MKKDKNTKLIISKSPELNAMRNGYPTLREQRILATYLARINPLDPESRTIRFTFKEFAKLCGLKDESVRGMNFEDFRKIARSILHKVVSLRTKTGGYLDFVLFSQSLTERDSETGECYIELSASPEGMQFFFELKQYIKFDLEIVLALKSLNQIRLYEILKENEWRKNFDMKLDDLRALLFITPEEYALFNDFNKAVLTVCQKAINELTDITFTYTTKRTGRKIGIVSFTVLPKPKLLMTSEPEQLTLISEDKPPPKTAQEKKNALAKAKESDFWYYAYEKAKKAKNIKISAEAYARGIVDNWQAAGYESVSDLVESGEISKQDVSKKPSFDLEEIERLNIQRREARMKAAKEKKNENS